MMLPRAVVIHGLDHARAALRPGCPVTLLSAPAAALYAGAGWWRAVIAAARTDAPHTDAPDILDCADGPGRALEALAAGCKILVLLPCPAWPAVADRAAFYGARLLPSRPDAIDLAEPGAARQIAGWLALG